MFDELLLLEGSDLPTSSVTVEAGTADDVRSLLDLFEGRDLGAEPVSSFQMLCSCCSTGTVEQNSEHHQAGRQTVWLAAPEDALVPLLDQWQAEASAQRSWYDLRTGAHVT